MQLRKLSPKIQILIDACMGGLLCAALATLAAYLFSENAHRAVVPLVFIVILLSISLRFGVVSGILGGVAAALIFSYFLFSPVGSLQVEAQQARDNLGWMLLLGIPASYFVATSRGDTFRLRR
jgi:K+-sensing histidine kinase KdpD